MYIYIYMYTYVHISGKNIHPSPTIIPPHLSAVAFARKKVLQLHQVNQGQAGQDADLSTGGIALGKTLGKPIGTRGKIIGKPIGKWKNHRKSHGKMVVCPLVNAKS